MIRKFCIVLFVLLTASCSTTQMQPVSVGEAISVAGLEDQHGKSFDSPSNLEMLLYVNGMIAKDLARTSIKKVNVQCLTKGRVAYIADISRMPSIISYLVAVPRLREYPYPIWLDYEGASTGRLPASEASVTVIDVVQGKITGIDFIAEESILTKRLIGHCGSA